MSKSDSKRCPGSKISKRCRGSCQLLYTKPSNEFLEFLKKGALLDFNRQLEGVTDVLKLDKDSVIADLERRLRSQGWNVKDAQEQREEDWRGNVHAQGWPVIWIVPRFHTQISVLLYSTIGEYIEKMKFQEWQVEATWRIIQPSDPEFLRYAIHIKPDDIAPLFVKEKGTWFQELTEHEDIVVSGLPSEGWVCLFESRHLSQDTEYQIPYKSQVSTATTFFDPRFTINKDQILNLAEWKEEIVSFHPYECLTLDQAQVFLVAPPPPTNINHQTSGLPTISLKHNPIAFFGFEYVVSLPSFVIQEFDLQFKNFNLYKDTQKVTDFEYWREGYVDEAYSRDILSYGTRFLVRADFLKELILRYGMQLCRKIFEKQLFFKDWNKQTPDDSVSKTRIELLQA